MNTKFHNDYLIAALWSSTDDKGEPLDDNYDISDIALKSVNAMLAECDDFIDYCNKLGIDMDETDHPGHDFWLTRNGHGAGFWDGGYPINGDALTHAAKTFGSVDLYVGDDNTIYQMGAE